MLAGAEYVFKGAGSYLAGMAVAIPILNGDGRRHTKNYSKDGGGGDYAIPISILLPAPLYVL